MKLNFNRLALFQQGKVGVQVMNLDHLKLAKKMDPEFDSIGSYSLKDNKIMKGVFVSHDFPYHYPDWFFEPEDKENDTTGPVVFDDFFLVMSKNDYEQHATIARRLYETCDNDILLTFRVLKKLITWAQTKNLREKYVCAALVLTELFLTEFKD